MNISIVFYTVHRLMHVWILLVLTRGNGVKIILEWTLSWSLFVECI